MPLTGSPYDVLGLPSDADDKLIRQAYRALSRRAHPDAGGNPADFEELKAARDLLLDKRRRAKFDATGEIEPSQADNAQAQVLGTLAGLLQCVVSELVQRGASPARNDVLLLMRFRIEQNRRQRRKELDETRKAIAALEEVQKRLKPEGNALAKIAASDMADLHKNLDKDKQITRLENEVLELLAGYQYSLEPDLCPGCGRAPRDVTHHCIGPAGLASMAPPPLGPRNFGA